MTQYGARPKSVAKEDEKAAVVFTSIQSIVDYFDKNPAQLTAYVRRAMKLDIFIPGFHIMQLAQKVGLGALSQKRGDTSEIVTSLSKTEWIKSSMFREMEHVISTAYLRFRVQLERRSRHQVSRKI